MPTWMLRVGVGAVLVVVAGLAFSSAGQASSRSAFGFNGSLSGFPTGAAVLTGGGSYNPTTASNTPGTDTVVVAGGGFRCTEDINQGPLAGCKAGEGVRWDTAQLLASTAFKCNGAADTPNTVTTDSDTAVLMADFYRAGDGVDESFTAAMFVSSRDQRPDLPGDQKIWIAGVGCGNGIVNFNAH